MLRKLIWCELKKPLKFGLLGGVLLILLVLLSIINNPGPSRKISSTLINLKLYRSNIQTYKEIMSQYPETLASIHKYANKNPDKKIDSRKFKEYISSSEGVWSESDKLNGSGGWYYEEKTGEIRVNLVKPVKKYLALYFGSHRNEIPADW